MICIEDTLADLLDLLLITLLFVSCLGKKPYAGLGGMEVVEFLNSGKRLPKPERCPDEL